MEDLKKYDVSFRKSGTRKRLVVSFVNPAVTLSDEDIVAESMEISESLCTERELRFGSCEASDFKLRVIGNVIPLQGEKFSVSMYVGDIPEPYVLGTYKVASDKPTGDRRYRDIVAYDAMHDIITADVAAWYNAILPGEDSKITLRAFRASFMEHFGIECEEVDLPNDGMIVERTINPEMISGQDVLTAVCEINGCFGHIGRNGKMRYITLEEIISGVYPRNDLFPSDDLFPAESKGTERIARTEYISCRYEDFKTQKINKLQIRQEENDIGCIIGEGDNCYVVEGNFLVYGKSTEELLEIGRRLYDTIRVVWYRPASVKAIGNPCLEVGNGIRLHTKNEIIETYILERTLKGIQSLTDSYETQGKEKYTGDVNSVHKSIVQIQGKINRLTRTAEETRSELLDLDRELSSQILQTAEEISLEVKRAQTVEASLSVRADNISAYVSNLDNILSSQITQTADSITAEVKRAQAAEADLSVRADNISLSVTNLEESVQSEIEVLSDAINLRTTQGQVSSMISVALDEIVISSNQIRLEGYTTINGGFKVYPSGSVEIRDGNTSAWLSGNFFEITTSGSGSSRIGSNFILMYDSSYINTYAVAYVSGTTLHIGDGSCDVSCGSVDCSGDISCSTLNGYVPITRSEFTSLRERVAKLETQVG